MDHRFKCKMQNYSFFFLIKKKTTIASRGNIEKNLGDCEFSDKILDTIPKAQPMNRNINFIKINNNEKSVLQKTVFRK